MRRPPLRTLALVGLTLAACDATEGGPPEPDDSAAIEPPAGLLADAPAEFIPHALLAVGGGWRVAGESAGDLAVLALDTDLALDPTWGASGAFVADLGGAGGLIPRDLDAAYALAADGDGLWVGGAGRGVSTASEGQFALVRLDARGAPDTSFGEGGARLTDWGQPSAIEHVTPTDAGLIAWGQVRNPDDLDLAAVRYDATGGVDASFADGNGGAGVLEPRPGLDDASVVLRDGDGHLIGGGAFSLRRVTSSGAFDVTFGEAGTLNLGEGRLDLGAPTPDGGAWLAGVGPVGEVAGLRVVKLTPDRALDPTFGVDGVATIEVPLGILVLGDATVPTTVIRVRGLAPLDDGRLVAYVQLLGLTSQVPALMVLTPDGLPDSTLGPGGVVVLDGAFGFLEGSLDAHDALLGASGDRAVVVDRWLREAEGGALESYAVALSVPLTPP
jgi:uncharacterized delta-60 repeat protein